jgi:hypothetical protein
VTVTVTVTVTVSRSCAAAHQILFGDRMKEKALGGACGTRGGEREEVHTWCWFGVDT